MRVLRSSSELTDSYPSHHLYKDQLQDLAGCTNQFAACTYVLLMLRASVLYMYIVTRSCEINANRCSPACCTKVYFINGSVKGSQTEGFTKLCL